MKGRTASGVLALDKGAGLTSFQAVAGVRRALGVRKIGHGGTLDPEATGVLPILIGEATKLTPYLNELDKEYVATVRLGVLTDTQDLTGAVLETRPVPPLEPAAVEAVLTRFVGTIRQVPPMYSALHHGGQRLYELARAGQTVEREAREVTIHALRLVSMELPDLTLHVQCGKGTYVRTLAADVGTALGTAAALARLVRTRVGPYRVDDAVPWPAAGPPPPATDLWRRLQPIDSALQHLGIARLDASQARAFTHGQRVRVPDAPAGQVRVYASDGVFLGIGVAHGGLVRPERLFNADHSRPAVLPA